MKQTYYIVQVSETHYIHYSGELAFVDGYGERHAARLPHYMARRVYSELRAAAKDDARRFPRIIKVTVETKTITPRR